MSVYSPKILSLVSLGYLITKTLQSVIALKIFDSFGLITTPSPSLIISSLNAASPTTRSEISVPTL